MSERICKAIDQQIDQQAVSVFDEETGRNVCGLCGSAELEMGYGLAGGGGCGVYNFCHGCNRVLDKSEDGEPAQASC